jgi:hypothetical protein
MSETAIKVLGICGSTRLKSTDYAINEAIAYARDRHDVAPERPSLGRPMRRKRGRGRDAGRDCPRPRVYWSDKAVVSSRAVTT